MQTTLIGIQSFTTTKDVRVIICLANINTLYIQAPELNFSRSRENYLLQQESKKNIFDWVTELLTS